MLVYWFIVLSSANQLHLFYDNQEISKEPEADDQVVPFIMVDKSYSKIDCIYNVFKAGDLSKSERLIQTWKNPHEKVSK